jgi:glycosyltransferase involved in cell wall biosynthesis
MERLAPTTERPEISVIIPAYRGRKTIPSCVAAVIKAVQGWSFEIIVVESSGDGTAELLETSFPQVTVAASATQLSAGQARNYGIQRARGQWLFCVDQDCEVPPDWIRRLLSHLSKEGVGAAGGSISVANPANTSGWCVYFLEFLNHFPSRSTQPSSTRINSSNFLIGANSAWRPDVFRTLSFPDQTLGEDLLLSQNVRALGLSIIYDSSITVFHHNRSGWGEFQRYCKAMGKASAQDQRMIADWRFQLLESWPFLSYTLPWIILPLIGWRLLSSPPGYMARFLLLFPFCLWGQFTWATTFRHTLIQTRTKKPHRCISSHHHGS